MGSCTSAKVVHPLLLEKGYHGYDLFVYRSRFYALSPELDSRSVLTDDGLRKKCQGNRKCLVGYSLDELKYYADRAISRPDREEYLVRCLMQIIAGRFSQPVTSVERYLGFHVILCRQRFYALRRLGRPGLGPSR